jgi:hypothetical protein
MMGVREGASWVVCLLLGLALLLKLDELGAEAGRPIIVCVATEGGVESAPAELPLCGSKHRNIGVDCSGWPSYHTAGYVGQAEIAPPAPSGGAAMLSDPDDPAQAHQVGSPRPFAAGPVHVPGAGSRPRLLAFHRPTPAALHPRHRLLRRAAWARSGAREPRRDLVDALPHIRLEIRSNMIDRVRLLIGSCSLPEMNVYIFY